jgi:hypothetical protein
LADAPKNSGKAVAFLWVVFQPGDPPIFLGLFHERHNAEEYAAKIEGPRIERVALRDKADCQVLMPMIG